MRKVFYVFVILATIATVGVCQDKIKLSASYLNTEFQANPLESLEYLKGFSIDADARIFAKDGFRLGGVFSYQRVYNQVVFEDYNPMPLPTVVGMDIQRNVNTYKLGFQLSKRLGPIEPFGAFLLGFKQPHKDLAREAVRTGRFGVDIIFYDKSNFFIRPLFVEFNADKQRRTINYGAGAGVRF